MMHSKAFKNSKYEPICSKEDLPLPWTTLFMKNCKRFWFCHPFNKYFDYCAACMKSSQKVFQKILIHFGTVQLPSKRSSSSIGQIFSPLNLSIKNQERLKDGLSQADLLSWILKNCILHDDGN